MKISITILSAIVAFILAFTWQKDLIPVHGGYGWDGQKYGMYTQYWHQAVEQKAINRFRMQRMLMPAILAKFLHKDGKPVQNEQVIQAYKIGNIISISVSIILFVLIAIKMKWSIPQLVIGFASAFYSFSVLKMSMYYPVLGDLPAMAFGWLAVFMWVHHYRLGLLATILVGCFTAPTMFLFSTLLIFPREKVDVPNIPKWIFPALLSVIFLSVWAWSWLYASENFLHPPSFSQPVQTQWLWLSLPIAIAWIALVGTLVPRLTIPLIKKIFLSNWLWILILIGGLAGVRWLILYWSGTEMPPQSISGYIQLILAQSVTHPGSFIVAHAVYYPGLLLLTLIAVSQINHTLFENGYGAALLMVGTGILLMGTESRQLIQMLPFIIVVLTQSLGRLNIKVWVAAAVAFISLIASRWWMYMGHPEQFSGNFLSFPAQQYFQFQGPWMNSSSWMKGAIAVVIAWGLMVVLKKHRFISLRAQKSK